MLRYQQCLFRIEREIEELPSDERQRIRQRKSRRVLAVFHLWLLAQRQLLPPGSATIKAIDYSLKRWAALGLYATDGRLPIDNNPVENAIRPIAIGKKNWLFVGSERAGKRAAAIQSLLATAKLNGPQGAMGLLFGNEDDATKIAATIDRANTDRATTDRATIDRDTIDRATADCATADRATIERATADCATIDRANTDPATADSATTDRDTIERATTDSATRAPTITMSPCAKLIRARMP